MILGLQITQQAIFYGACTGLVYAIFAAGFVLVYRCTGILNFAQGEIGAFCVAVFTVLTAGYGVPYWISFGLAVALGALVGMVIELTVVRRLFNAPRLTLLIATIGVSQLLVVGRFSLPTRAAGKPFPLPFDVHWQLTDSVFLASREILILLVAPLTIVALAYFMARTRFGRRVRASASNPDTARLYGISVKQSSTVVWMIAGAFAALTAIMIAPIRGITPGTILTSGSVAVGPGLLVRALVVALFARMRSLPLTLAGGVGLGVAEMLVRANVAKDGQNVVELWLFVATIVLVLVRMCSPGTESTSSLVVQVKPIPERLRRLWYVRRLGAMGFAVLFGVLALLPVVLQRNSQLFLWSDVLIFAMMALPLSMLMGWAGQFSLGQFAFVGLGAGVMVMLTNGLDIPVPFDLWDASLELPWGVAALLATAVGVVSALLIGLPALRVRGMFLAVVTLAFAVAASGWLFEQGTFTGSEFQSTTPFMRAPELFGIDFGRLRNFYYLCLASLVVMTLVMVRVRRTGIGRSMVAVSDNEDMAAVATVSPQRVKLIAFALAGGMSAFAGSLFVTLRVQVDPASTFGPDVSLRLVATAIIGGMGSAAGPIVGAIFVRGVPALIGDVPEVQLMTSGIGLLILLMYFPGGLMQIASSIRDWLLSRVDVGAEADAPPARTQLRVRPPAPDVAPAGPWLRLEDVSVRFGGLRAVDGISMDVGAGEVVGLIGTNGAGKSTLMNAISGLVPSTGRVELFGRDVNALPAHRRHRLGLARGFQAARLYPDLTVRETVMVALEARERSWTIPSLTGLPPSPAAERRKRSDAGELLDFLGLGPLADHFTAHLSTGTRRIVELACLLAADARVLMLDEPSGGVAQRETEAFGPLIARIRRDLGASMVVIEHDMPLIMSISDRVYCLEAGRVIACGTPAEVRSDPRVIASYLGTDERAIERSHHQPVEASRP